MQTCVTVNSLWHLVLSNKEVMYDTHTQSCFNIFSCIGHGYMCILRSKYDLSKFNLIL